MKLLKSKTGFTRWMRDRGLTDPQPPREYPCFAYSVVRSFNYEEEQEHYLYLIDVVKMEDALRKAGA